MKTPREQPEIRDSVGDRRRLSLRQIEIFRTVMVAGSINAASRVLGISQPSLSRVVRRTEDVLGFALFERAKGRLLPTKEAATLFAQVGRVYEQLDELRAVVDRISAGDDGVFRFGTTGSPGRHLVPRAIAAIRRGAPGLAYHVDVLLLEQIIDYLVLQRGECVVSVFPVHHPLIQSRALGDGDLVCLIPADHRLAERSVVAVTDLADEFLVLYEKGTPHGQVAEDLFASRGLTPRVGARVRHIETAVGLVASGVGIAVVDEFAVRDDPASARFRVARIAGAPRLHVHLNWNRDTVRSQFLRALQDHLSTLLAASASAAQPMP